MNDAFDSLNDFKFSTAYEFFVAPADRDYLFARWLFINGFPEFFWHASQAVEKYLKAGLVLNGEKLKKGNHDIESLYKKHCQIFDTLAFKCFTKPLELSVEFWRDSTVDLFVKRINDMGNPDSRYGLVSWHRRNCDLFKFDQLCWHLRRLTIGLNWNVNEDFPCEPAIKRFAGKTYREVLTENPTAQPRGTIGNLTKTIVGTGPLMSDLFHAWNFEFLRDEVDLSKAIPNSLKPQLGPFKNSILFLYWKALTQTDSSGALLGLSENFKDGMQWLVSSIKLNTDLEKEIRAKLEVKRTGRSAL